MVKTKREINNRKMATSVKDKRDIFQKKAPELFLAKNHESIIKTKREREREREKERERERKRERERENVHYKTETDGR